MTCRVEALEVCKRRARCANRTYSQPLHTRKVSMDRRARDHDFFFNFFLVEAVQELVDRRARGDDFKEYSTTFDLSCAKMVSKVPSLPLSLPLPLPLPTLQLLSLSSSSSLPLCLHPPPCPHAARQLPVSSALCPLQKLSVLSRLWMRQPSISQKRPRNRPVQEQKRPTDSETCMLLLWACRRAARTRYKKRMMARKPLRAAK